LVWAVVYSIIKEPTATEDIVQETFIKAWTSIKSLQDPNSFRTWLMSIARNCALEHNDKTIRQGKILNDPAHKLCAGQDETTGKAELNGRLHQALQELPDKYRVPITLRYLEGFDYQKIALTLGITDGSLRGLLNRGMKILREELREI